MKLKDYGKRFTLWSISSKNPVSYPFTEEGLDMVRHYLLENNSVWVEFQVLYHARFMGKIHLSKRNRKSLKRVLFDPVGKYPKSNFTLKTIEKHIQDRLRNEGQ